MNLVSLLILPAVIKARHEDYRYGVAAAALLVLLAAIAFSKRKTQGLDAGGAGLGAISGPSNGEMVMEASRDDTLRAAIDRWIYDLGHDQHELRERLLQVKRQLESSSPG